MSQNTPAPEAERPQGVDFLRARINQDNLTGRFGGRVHTRFPPEPNGYLHIGHAKSICINFGLAKEYGGLCNLRFDDTNPVKEDTEYVDSIQKDVQWLGFQWAGDVHYASDYFDQLYEYAEKLIMMGKAYVDELSADEIREYRGTLTRPGTPSPWRDRPAEESLDLFRRMKAGEFEDGRYVLRAKIDMASPNVIMRDPTIYRIRHATHHRTGDKWCIYPMYDFTHCLSDSIEGITHSICTLEFDNNRELYDWVLDTLGVYHSQQIEFARLQLTYTVLSKRKLIQLVKEHYVRGWDDPRMPTISGLRRRGYTPESIRDFCSRIGIARSADSVVHYSLLEFCCREHLNAVAPRCMAVLNPLKVVITDYPEDQVEEFDQPLHPEDASFGSRKVPFCREIYIDRDDFREDPPKKYFRLAPRRGSAPALRLLHHLSGSREGRRRQHRGTALHPRSFLPRRLQPRRPQGQGHAALGERPSRRSHGSAPLRADVHHRKRQRHRRRQDLPRLLQPRFRKDRHGHGGTLSRHDARRQPRAVRARGLFLRRSRRHARTPPCSTAP